MSHREGGRLNLSTLPLVGRQREQRGIMGQRSHPYTLCKVLPELCSATTESRGESNKAFKKHTMYKMKACNLQSMRPEQNPFRSACYET